MSVYRRIQVRRGTATEWLAPSQPVVLHQGEIGLDLTAKRIKIGDGFKDWSQLEYVDDPGLESLRQEYGNDNTFELFYDLHK